MPYIWALAGVWVAKHLQAAGGAWKHAGGKMPVLETISDSQLESKRKMGRGPKIQESL